MIKDIIPTLKDKKAVEEKEYSVNVTAVLTKNILVLLFMLYFVFSLI